MFTSELYRLFLEYPKVVTDTRQDVSRAIFFALQGEHFNGNLYAEEALKKGAAYAVVDDENLPDHKDFIRVDNTLLALQDLANFHRNQLQIPLIAITGTNGKTTTKELAGKILKKKYQVVYTEGNLNNHIGVPLTLLRLSGRTEIAIIEMGANHVGEIALLCEIARPEFGLITNIGKAHLEGFGGPQGVVRAKSELYKYILANAGKLFVNNANPLLDELSGKITRITYGAMPDADCHGKIHSADPLINVTWDSVSGKKIIRSQLYGAYNFENIMAGICIGNYFKVPPDEIVRAIEDYVPSNQRSQIIQSEHNTIIMDAYNANPTSMMLALKEFTTQASDNKTLILGDMLEMGRDSKKEHQVILDFLENTGIKEVFLVGPEFSSLNKNPGWKVFENISGLCSYLETNKLTNRHFFIKGSRGIQLEKCLDLL